MGKVPNPAVLKSGDIILTTAEAFSSAAIRSVSKSDISHAMLYVSRHSVIDSTMEGVQARNIQRLIYPVDLPVHVRRLNRELTSVELEKIITYGRSRVGTQYSLLEAARSLSKPASKAGKRQYCSRLVSQAYWEAGIGLVADVDYCTPDEVKDSGELVVVEDGTIALEASQEADIAASTDLNRLMIEANGTFFSSVRRLDRSIQTFDDAVGFAAASPKNDHGVAEALLSSGWMSVLDVELSTHGWRYINALFKYHADWLAQEGRIEELLSYCLEATSEESNSTFATWEKTMQAFYEMSKQKQTRTVDLLLAHYTKLVTVNTLRIQLARDFLASREQSGQL